MYAFVYCIKILKTHILFFSPSIPKIFFFLTEASVFYPSFPDSSVVSPTDLCLLMYTSLKGFVLRYLLPLPSSSSSVFAGNSCSRLQTLHVFCFNINSSKRSSRKEVKGTPVSITPRSLWATTQELWPALYVHYRKKNNIWNCIFDLPWHHATSTSSPFQTSFFLPFSSVVCWTIINQERLIPTKKVKCNPFIFGWKTVVTFDALQQPSCQK